MPNQDVSIRSFLKNFGGTNTLFQGRGRYSMAKATSLQSLLDSNGDRDKCDAYFVVNPGGAKANEIKKLTTVFIDLDAGRGTNGKYYGDRTVLGRKSKMMAAIKHFPLKPSFIIETRNGYQVYWLLSNTKLDTNRLKRWNKVQDIIHSYFSNVGADDKVMKVNQIMRLPYTTWWKKWEKKKEYYVRPIATGARKYRLDDFKPSLADLGKNNKGFKSAGKVGSPDRFAVAKRSSPHYNTGGGDDKLILNVIEFLREINPILFQTGHKFLAKSANQLAGKLSVYE